MFKVIDSSSEDARLKRKEQEQIEAKIKSMLLEGSKILNKLKLSDLPIIPINLAYYKDIGCTFYGLYKVLPDFIEEQYLNNRLDVIENYVINIIDMVMEILMEYDTLLKEISDLANSSPYPDQAEDIYGPEIHNLHTIIEEFVCYRKYCDFLINNTKEVV